MNTSSATLEQRKTGWLTSSSVSVGETIPAKKSPLIDFKVVHISDPHLSRQFYREHLKSFKLLLRSLLDAGCDHLVITGDIVSTADEDDYYLAREILGKLDLLDSRRLTVVPGNHDIFGGPHRAVDVLSFPQHIRNVDYARHLERFQRVFAETFQNVVSYGHDSVFPFVKKIGPYSIIGMNSIPQWSLLKNPFGTNGRLDEIQREALTQMHRDHRLVDTIPLVAIHHHFNDLQDDPTKGSWWKRVESKTMRMRGRNRTLRLFESLGVRYVLHGHIHRNEIYRNNEITLMNGAGAVCDDPIKFLKFNELRYVKGKEYVRTNVLPIPFQTTAQAVSRQRLHYPIATPPLPSVAK